MARKPYRCDICLAQPTRCASCAARRAEAVRQYRASHRAEGKCTECSRKTEPGMSRCKRHRKDNNRRSAAAHAARAITTIALLVLAGCAGAAHSAEPSDDAAVAESDAGPQYTDRDPPDLYEEAGSYAPTPPPAGTGAAGAAGTGAAGTDAAGTGAAGSAGEPTIDAGAAGSAGSAGAAGAAGESAAGAGGAAGAAGAADGPAAGAPAPVQPERFCKINPGQRLSGQTLGCDTYSRTGFPFLVLRWRVNVNTTAGCANLADMPCATGAECRLDDSREGQPTQYGVCL